MIGQARRYRLMMIWISKVRYHLRAAVIMIIVCVSQADMVYSASTSFLYLTDFVPLMSVASLTRTCPSAIPK